MLPSLAYLVTSPPECPEVGSMLAMVLSLLLTHPLRDLACLCVLCFLTNSCIIMPPSWEPTALLSITRPSFAAVLRVPDTTPADPSQRLLCVPQRMTEVLKVVRTTIVPSPPLTWMPWPAAASSSEMPSPLSAAAPRAVPASSPACPR